MKITQSEVKKLMSRLNSEVERIKKEEEKKRNRIVIERYKVISEDYGILMSDETFRKIHNNPRLYGVRPNIGGVEVIEDKNIEISTIEYTVYPLR
mgnify:CR=1 FL=1